MSTIPETRNARPTVLLVEDDEMLRRLLSRILGDENFRVLEAENGDIALKLLSGLNRPPEVVLTDVAMPVMDGFQFARIFRSLYPAVPILFMTGALLQVQGTPLRDMGARVLVKPFHADVLLEAVISVLDDERGRLGAVS
ncbi:MAG TPA: response regulator [Gemmatimonadales bacterium]|nr:response regulator [Gemmatimonadales bacterium]